MRTNRSKIVRSATGRYAPVSKTLVNAGLVLAGWTALCGGLLLVSDQEGVSTDRRATTEREAKVPAPRPVSEQELYGKWDGVVTVDGQTFCLENWPCYDFAVNPGFEG